MRRINAFAVLVFCASIAACSGSGGNRIVPNTQTTTAPGKVKANATFAIHVPAKRTNAAREPQYVSPSTTQVSISVNGGTPVVAPLSPTAPGCTSASNGFTCAVIVAAPVGNDTFAISLLDADSTVLSTLTVSENVASGVANSYGIVLGGVIASLTIALATSAPVANGQAQQIALTVNGVDADGNIIAGPGSYSAPISIADSDTSGTTSLSVGGSTPATTVSAVAPGSGVTVNYSGAPLPKGATFTASVPGTTVTPASATLTPTSGPTATTITLAITGAPIAIAYSNGTNGTWTALPAGATSVALSGTTAYGVAYMCSANGELFFVQATAAELQTVSIDCAQAPLGTISLAFQFAANSFCPDPSNTNEFALEVNVDGQDNQFEGCSTSAPFANVVQLNAVTQDIFAAATTGSNGDILLAVKTLTGASVPGTGTTTMTFNASDAVGTAAAPTISPAPATATSTQTQLYFGSFNNWAVPMLVSDYNSSSNSTYYTVADGDIGASDSYLAIGEAYLSGPGTANSVGADVFANALPAAIAMPTPLNEAVSPAPNPAFATTYAWGSTPSGNIAGYLFSAKWYTTSNQVALEGLVTAGFIGTSATYTLPNISVSGFPSTAAPAAASYSWRALAFNVPSPLFATLPFNELAPGSSLRGVPTSGPAQGSTLFAQAEGSFSVP